MSRIFLLFPVIRENLSYLIQFCSILVLPLIVIFQKWFFIYCYKMIGDSLILFCIFLFICYYWTSDGIISLFFPAIYFELILIILLLILLHLVTEKGTPHPLAVWRLYNTFLIFRWLSYIYLILQFR